MTTRSLRIAYAPGLVRIALPAGGGDLVLTPDEAIRMAAKLKQAAKAARVVHPEHTTH